jgi:hypothetical protein
LQPKDWIPFRWPGGDSWRRVESLALLKDSAINCLVISPAHPVADAAAKQGLAVVNPESVPPSIHVIASAKWPRIPTSGRGRRASDAGAGPTGAPWVDSNGWLAALAHARSPTSTVWLMEESPKDAGVIRGPQYSLAIADASAYNSRWVVSLDSALADGLAAGKTESIATWKRMDLDLRFFAAHEAWLRGEPQAVFGVLSDFAGLNEYLAGEILNLCNRRHLQYRVLDVAQPLDFSGLKGILVVMQTAPPANLQEKLNAFVDSGGLLIVPASLSRLAGGLERAGDFENRYEYFSRGNGRLAVAQKLWADPYAVASDAHLILSRKNDIVRLWNAGSTNAYYTRIANGDGLVQVLNYAARAFGNPVSLWVAHSYRTARLTVLGGDKTERLSITPKNGGSEVDLPPFDIYAAIEFGE